MDRLVAAVFDDQVELHIQVLEEPPKVLDQSLVEPDVSDARRDRPRRLHGHDVAPDDLRLWEPLREPAD